MADAYVGLWIQVDVLKGGGASGDHAKRTMKGQVARVDVATSCMILDKVEQWEMNGWKPLHHQVVLRGGDILDLKVLPTPTAAAAAAPTHATVMTETDDATGAEEDYDDAETSSTPYHYPKSTRAVAKLKGPDGTDVSSSNSTPRRSKTKQRRRRTRRTTHGDGIPGSKATSRSRSRAGNYGWSDAIAKEVVETDFDFEAGLAQFDKAQFIAELQEAEHSDPTSYPFEKLYERREQMLGLGENVLDEHRLPAEQRHLPRKQVLLAAKNKAMMPAAAPLHQHVQDEDVRSESLQDLMSKLVSSMSTSDLSVPPEEETNDEDDVGADEMVKEEPIPTTRLSMQGRCPPKSQSSPKDLTNKPVSLSGHYHYFHILPENGADTDGCRDPYAIVPCMPVELYRYLRQYHQRSIEKASTTKLPPVGSQEGWDRMVWTIASTFFPLPAWSIHKQTTTWVFLLGLPPTPTSDDDASWGWTGKTMAALNLLTALLHDAHQRCLSDRRAGRTAHGAHRILVYPMVVPTCATEKQTSLDEWLQASSSHQQTPDAGRAYTWQAIRDAWRLYQDAIQALEAIQPEARGFHHRLIKRAIELPSPTVDDVDQRVQMIVDSILPTEQDERVLPDTQDTMLPSVAKMIRWTNAHQRRRHVQVISLDVPSGFIGVAQSQHQGLAIQPSITISLGAPKEILHPGSKDSLQLWRHSVGEALFVAGAGLPLPSMEKDLVKEELTHGERENNVPVPTPTKRKLSKKNATFMPTQVLQRKASATKETPKPPVAQSTVDTVPFWSWWYGGGYGLHRLYPSYENVTYKRS